MNANIDVLYFLFLYWDRIEKNTSNNNFSRIMGKKMPLVLNLFVLAITNGATYVEVNVLLLKWYQQMNLKKII